MKALDPAPGAPIQIAPMAKKGEATPGMWTTIPNGIFGGMLARTGILPGVLDPSRLRGRPGFLDFVGDSEVLNKGGTRATVGYFIKVSRDTQFGNIPVQYFVLMSYDNIKTADGKQLNAVGIDRQPQERRRRVAKRYHALWSRAMTTRSRQASIATDLAVSNATGAMIRFPKPRCRFRGLSQRQAFL